MKKPKIQAEQFPLLTHCTNCGGFHPAGMICPTAVDGPTYTVTVSFKNQGDADTFAKQLNKIKATGQSNLASAIAAALARCKEIKLLTLPR